MNAGTPSDPHELARDLWELHRMNSRGCRGTCANCSRHVARGSTRDHAAEIVALADSPVIADEELVD